MTKTKYIDRCPAEHTLARFHWSEKKSSDTLGLPATEKPTKLGFVLETAKLEYKHLTLTRVHDGPWHQWRPPAARTDI